MHSAECRTTVPLKFLAIIHNYANVWTIKKVTTQFSGNNVTARHFNDSSIQTSLREQATCFAVQQHFPEANSEFEENEEMLNSEMEGGGGRDKLP